MVNECYINREEWEVAKKVTISNVVKQHSYLEKCHEGVWMPWGSTGGRGDEKGKRTVESMAHEWRSVFK